MVAFMKQLHSAAATVGSGQAFGWVSDSGGLTGFVLDGKLFSPAGTKQAARASGALAAIYRPTGKIDAWKELVRLINHQKRPALDMLIASALAAPLVRFTGEEGFATGGWSSKSGIGKSTALMLAASFFGHPTLSMAGLDDTKNSIMNIVGQIRNLPVMCDEIRSEKDKKGAVDIIFRLTGGVEKNRSRRDGVVASRGEWSTLITYAGNSTLQDAIADEDKSTVAGRVRLFEVIVPPSDVRHDPARINELKSLLKDNYGWAGLLYAEWLGANIDKIRADVSNIKASLRKSFQSSDDERFWISAMATLIIGVRYGNSLDLTDIDESGFRRFLFAEFTRMRSEKREAPNDFTKAENVVALFSQFFREKKPNNTLFTNRVLAKPGRPGPNDIKPQMVSGVNDRLSGQGLQIQIGLNDGVVRIVNTVLVDWLKQKNINSTTVIRAAREFLHAELKTAILGSGTDYSKGSAGEPVWQFNVLGTGLDTDWTITP